MTEQKKIFGTDGVRGVANVEPVTAETVLKLGRAAAYVLNPHVWLSGRRSYDQSLLNGLISMIVTAIAFSCNQPYLFA